MDDVLSFARTFLMGGWVDKGLPFQRWLAQSALRIMTKKDEGLPWLT